MNELYNCNDYNQFGRKPPRRKGKFLSYIALVLVTSLISSFVVGGVMYGKFSNELKSVKLAALSASAKSAASVNSGALQTSNSGNFASNGLIPVSTDKLVNTALPKGSTVTAIAKKAGPSIVGIRMTVKGTRQNYMGISNDETSEGSGIIISKDGYIMTNYHVVSSADPKSDDSSRTVLEVFTADGKDVKAAFKGGDSKTDLAVIKVNLNNLTPAELGDSTKLEVGETAVAIGNPLGMEFAGSVTVGVISALNRTVEMEDKTLKLIQTDAAINAGNSGGALLNSQGQVIGINSAKISASGVEGLGFSIPINDVKPIVDQLMKYGYVKGRVSMGIYCATISDMQANLNGLQKGGVYVEQVVAGSGAAKAGMQAGDIIVGINGKTIETTADLDKIESGYKPGTTVTINIMRDNSKLDLKLTFDEAK